MAIVINGSGTVTGVSVGGLPDGIVDTDMIAASAVTAAKASGSVKGITEFDMWRVNSDFAQQNAVISANWERADVHFEKIGTGLTESSGVFTFPSTGKYVVNFRIYSLESGGTRYHGGYIQLSTNSGVSFTTYSEGLLNAYNSGNNSYASNSQELCFDITDASTYRMQFHTTGDSTISYGGHTEQQRTGFTCMKIGDT